MVPRDALLTKLGCAVGEDDWVAAEKSGRTSVPGVYTVGNVIDPRAQVVNAAGMGDLARRTTQPTAHPNVSLINRWGAGIGVAGERMPISSRAWLTSIEHARLADRRCSERPSRIPDQTTQAAADEVET
jgi:hypothetical protein